MQKVPFFLMLFCCGAVFTCSLRRVRGGLYSKVSIYWTTQRSSLWADFKHKGIGWRITQKQRCWHITVWSALYLLQPLQSRASSCTTQTEPTGNLLPPGACSLTLMIMTKDMTSDSSKDTHLIARPMSLYLTVQCGAGLLSALWYNNEQRLRGPWAGDVVCARELA